jgi:hypothetical protein
MKIVYIVGRGHSGTTALDLLIGSNTGLASLGEVSPSLSMLDVATCSCGEKIDVCEKWRKVVNKNSKKHYISKLAELSKKYDHFEQIFKPKSKQENELYNKYLSNFYKKVCSVRDVDGIIDSSKELSKGLRIIKHFESSKLIYLRRALPSILLSYKKRFDHSSTFNFRRKNKRYSSFLPIAITIILSQIVAYLFYKILSIRFSTKIIKVKYESLENLNEIKRIMDHISCNINDVSFEIDMKQVHLLAGNRMARSGKLIDFKVTKIINEDYKELNLPILYFAKIVDKIFY